MESWLLLLVKNPKISKSNQLTKTNKTTKQNTRKNKQTKLDEVIHRNRMIKETAAATMDSISRECTLAGSEICSYIRLEGSQRELFMAVSTHLDTARGEFGW